MPERRAAFGGSNIGLNGHDAERMGGEIYYDLNYKLIEKKIVGMSIGGGKRQTKHDQRNNHIMMSHVLKDRKSGLGFNMAAQG